MKNLLHKITLFKKYPTNDILNELINQVRPKRSGNTEEAIEQIQNLLAHLRLHPEYRHALKLRFGGLFKDFDPVYLYAESGILSKHGFFSELWTKVKHKILPELKESKNSINILHELFHKQDDYLWMQQIPKELWVELLDLLDIHNLFHSLDKSHDSISSAMQLLSHHITTQGLDTDITNKLTNLDSLDSPFLIQNHELSIFLKSFNEKGQTQVNGISYKKVFDALDKCIYYIEDLHHRRDEFGTSLHLTLLSKRLLQQINRLKLLLKIMTSTDKNNFHHHFTELSITLVKAANQRNNLVKHINDHLDLLAFEMVEHTAQKGGRYIASNASEYWSYLRASMLGGAIIALFALNKILIDSINVAIIGQGLLFSLNYAVCFVLIYLLGGIIATKQPAMTASAVVRSMDKNDDGLIDDLKGLKDLIIKVSRSQFISFAGNLLMAIPVAYLLTLSFDKLLGISLISSDKSEILMEEIHPFESGAIYFAAIAGVFLSLSGLISGYFSNKLVFSRIPERIENHPGLRRFLSPGKTRRFALFIKKNLGALAGNISLGVFLGMAGTIGFITGLPFDIRHIAFSSANLGYALSSLNMPNLSVIMYLIIGIAGIGLMNFSVSFGMTLFIALKSRKISFGQSKTLISLIFQHFWQKPLDLFLHPGAFSFAARLFSGRGKRTSISKRD